MGYLAGHVGESDLEFTEHGEFGDGRGYCANEVVGVGDGKKIEVGKVTYGGGFSWLGMLSAEGHCLVRSPPWHRRGRQLRRGRGEVEVRLGIVLDLASVRP